VETEPGEGLPFDRRVRVLVEIVDDVDEIALANELFQANNWPVRPATDAERTGCLANHEALVVEVRLVGDRDGAVGNALVHVDGLAQAASLSMWARDAVLIEHLPEQNTEWRVGPAADSGERVERVLRIPGPDRGEGAVLAVLRERVFGTVRFDPAAHHTVRRAAVTDESRKKRANTTWIVSILAGLAGYAVLSERISLGTHPLLGISCVLLGAWMFSGITAALRGSSTSRHLSWCLPLIVPALAPLATWTGSLVHDRYVEYFGFPPDSVHVAATDRLWAGAVPVVGVVFYMLLAVATAGSLRRKHRLKFTESSALLSYASMGVWIGLVIMVFPLLVGLSTTGEALDARRAVQTGEQPAAYYGLKPRLICVVPLDSRVQPTAYNGPIPLDRPLLTFGPDGERIWLWDATDGEIRSMRLEDARFPEPSNGDCDQPDKRR
jgi:hypothetical protein